MTAFRAWLETAAANDMLDDAAMGGCLLDSYVVELCEDFQITRAEFRRALNNALAKGW